MEFINALNTLLFWAVFQAENIIVLLIKKFRDKYDNLTSSSHQMPVQGILVSTF